ncbi:MAG: MerR family transcriptional regulator [Dehalococcoidia bacterium]
MPYTVKAVADLAGVSIRALHHYDEIGLLKPASVSRSGYRLYTDADLERLQQVLFFRELGFGLQEIRNIIDSPAFDRKQALAMHRTLLVEKQQRLRALIQSVDKTIDAMERGRDMGNNEMFGGFDQSTMEAYREEARQRWGSAAVDESHRRVAKFTKADWDAIQTESDAINRGLVERMGEDAAGPAVQDLVGRWFNLINDRYYDCSAEIFRGLGDLYVNDSRFTVFYDKYKPGLAKFMQAAMHVYADRLGTDR